MLQKKLGGPGWDPSGLTKKKISQQDLPRVPTGNAPPAGGAAHRPRLGVARGGHDWNSLTSSAIQSRRPPALWCEPREPELLPCPAFRSSLARGARPPRRAPVAARCASFCPCASIPPPACPPAPP